jgi:hypothetical protein
MKMDISIYEGKEFNLTAYISQFSESDRVRTIERVKRMSEKGAMICPFCNEKLIIKAGLIRDIHFAHLKGQSCLFSEAYDTYQAQVQRENQKHSIIKEAVYNELKSQVIIKPDLHVEYGYIEKADEKWRMYPDIYVKKNEKEFAISVITGVNSVGDDNVVKMIKKKNEYFQGKGLNVIWFVEDRELADDLNNRVIHLWEAEYELAIKTGQDSEWDLLLDKLNQEDAKHSLFDIFKYKKDTDPSIDVKSLYYVHSVGDGMTFSVYRLILDERKYPFRAFAVNGGYRISMSDALVIRENILLSDAQKDHEDRRVFEELYFSNKKKIYEEYEEQQRELVRQQQLRDDELRNENERQRNRSQEREQKREDSKRNQSQFKFSQAENVAFDIGFQAIKEKLQKCKVSPMLKVYPAFHSHIEYCDSIVLKMEQNEATKNEYDSLLGRIHNMIIPLLGE